MVKRTSPALLLLICVMVLAGCGQKGPLHMPEEREQTQDASQLQEMSVRQDLQESSSPE